MFRAPPVNVGAKFPVPPEFPDVMPPDPTSVIPAFSDRAGSALGSRLVQSQLPPTTYGFSSGNPGQLPGDANAPHDNAHLSIQNRGMMGPLERALRIGFNAQSPQATGRYARGEGY